MFSFSMLLENKADRISLKSLFPDFPNVFQNLGIGRIKKKKKKVVKFILAPIKTSDKAVKLLNYMGQIL